ncbi:MAG: hypothetical protein K0B37_09495 [Bacteroidales bacterium]|nr:hypothetical protein [Bacteroidales bacterium]
MKKLMNILFLSCLKATELIEKKLYFKLSVKEKMQLKMHKMMCDACTNYEKQSMLMDHALLKIEKPEKISLDLSTFKKNIQKKMEGSK